MRRLILAAALLIPLSGCQTIAGWLGGTPSASTQTAIVHGVLAGCDAFYKGALPAAFVADDAHLLTDAVKADIKSVRLGVDAICPPSGTMPTNATAALLTVVEGSAKIYSDIGAKPAGAQP